jgi:hypothetical protein
MQKAEAVLSAIRKRGKEGKPLQRIYRQLFNRNLYLLAYYYLVKVRDFGSNIGQ